MTESKYIRRRIIAVFWAGVVIAEVIWITPMLFAALDARLGL